MSSAVATEQGHASFIREALSRNVGVDVFARVGYLLSRFLIPPFVLAHIGLEAYGLWATAFILVSYLGVSTIGVSGVYIKYVAEYMARGEYSRANELLSTGTTVTIMLSMLLFSLLVPGLPQVLGWLRVPHSLESDARIVVMMVVAVFLMDIALSGFDDALSGSQRTAEVQVIWMLSYLVEAGLIFLLVGAGFGIKGLASAFVVRTILANGLSAIVAFRTLPWLRISPRLCTGEAGRLLISFGGIVQIQSLLAIGLNSIERTVAAPLIGLAATGLLDIGKKLPAMAASVPSAFASAFTPAASFLQGGLEGTSEGRDAIAKLYLKGARYMNLSAAYICSFLAAAPSPILAVWIGKLYPGTALLMVAFSLSTQIHLMTGPGTSMLRGLGQPLQEFVYSLTNLFMLAVALPVAWLIVGSWTIVGIGLAVASATIISATIFILWVNRLLGVPYKRYLTYVALPGFVPYLAGALFTLPSYYAIPHMTRWQGAAFMGVMGCCYTGVLLLVIMFGVLEAGERYWFSAVLRDHITRLILTFREGEA